MGKNEKQNSFEELQFIRIFDPRHIPKYLIEQIKHRTWEIDHWYNVLESSCFTYGESGKSLNPLNLLFAISDADYRVVGMLWATVDVLEQALVIQNFSMDSSYWQQGKAVNFLADKAKEIVKGAKLQTIFWTTWYPKHSQKHGFKRSKHVLMEWREEYGDGIDEASGNGGIASAGAAAVSAGAFEPSGSPGDSEPCTDVAAGQPGPGESLQPIGSGADAPAIPAEDPA